MNQAIASSALPPTTTQDGTIGLPTALQAGPGTSASSQHQTGPLRTTHNPIAHLLKARIVGERGQTVAVPLVVVSVLVTAIGTGVLTLLGIYLFLWRRRKKRPGPAGRPRSEALDPTVVNYIDSEHAPPMQAAMEPHTPRRPSRPVEAPGSAGFLTPTRRPGLSRSDSPVDLHHSDMTATADTQEKTAETMDTEAVDPFITPPAHKVPSPPELPLPTFASSPIPLPAPVSIQSPRTSFPISEESEAEASDAEASVADTCESPSRQTLSSNFHQLDSTERVYACILSSPLERPAPTALADSTPRARTRRRKKRTRVSSIRRRSWAEPSLESLGEEGGPVREDIGWPLRPKPSWV
ncbi:uncharacterized protein C8A04DRAFT_26184 [Dichotomopilus funicola]|uniref:Uncharacterized protein n=1 Tax=Dichotomopilus funicola TaxID=1934379 RepID=A0AAN6V6Z2_9PEZI|nr:hypothetical protein C8A04DRAFT_26184 [Dichotomopilus funicola]